MTTYTQKQIEAAMNKAAKAQPAIPQVTRSMYEFRQDDAIDRRLLILSLSEAIGQYGKCLLAEIVFLDDKKKTVHKMLIDSKVVIGQLLGEEDHDPYSIPAIVTIHQRESARRGHNIYFTLKG